ncbi:MAG: alpha-ribazole phosphatase [Anaerolineae bacterium]|nr:alpha-ribazole phosphatase [Anaerolineae bacterium]
MLRLLLIRHGQTLWNAELRYQGQTDVPLNELGRRQAEALGRRLAGETIHAVYASDLQRAVDTAIPLAVPRRLEIIKEPRLRELNFGEWEGHTFEEIRQRDPEAYQAWLRAPERFSAPGGETDTQLRERVRAWLDEVRAKHDEQTIAVVAHGGSLIILLQITLGLPSEARWKFRMTHGSISELHLFPDGWAVLARLNDTCHLDGLTG